MRRARRSDLSKEERLRECSALEAMLKGLEGCDFFVTTFIFFAQQPSIISRVFFFCALIYPFFFCMTVDPLLVTTSHLYDVLLSYRDLRAWEDMIRLLNV